MNQINPWKKIRVAAAAALALSMAFGGNSMAGGVNNNEVVVGTILDLSGPVAMLGEHYRQGMQMRYDEVNAAGGVFGRKIRMISEDSGWDTKKAVLATRKLLDKDDVFALINVLGSSIAVATGPLALEKGVPNLFPAAPVDVAFKPLSPLKYGTEMPYDMQVPIGVRYLTKTAGYKKVGVIFQDDDFGKDVVKGLTEITKELGQPICEQSSFRRGSTDFASQVARMKQAGCDLVVIGGSTREAIGIMGEARKLDWSPGFMVTSSAYSAQLHTLGGPVVNGLYSTVAWPHPYEDGANPKLAAWIKAYKERYKADPSPFATAGYIKGDMFVKALEQTGKALTTDAFVKVMGNFSYTGGEMFGVPKIHFDDSNHLGLRTVRMGQIKNGRWQLISDAL